MPRYFPNMKMGFAATVRFNGELSNAPQITFIYKVGKHGTETTITPTNVGIGTYVVELVPNGSGHLSYRWDTDGDLDVAQEGIVNIKESAFT
jgi:hypothetical protein